MLKGDLILTSEPHSGLPPRANYCGSVPLIYRMIYVWHHENQNRARIGSRFVSVARCTRACSRPSPPPVSRPAAIAQSALDEWLARREQPALPFVNQRPLAAQTEGDARPLPGPSEGA